MAVEWNAEQIAARVRMGAKKGVLIGAQRVHDTAVKKIINGPKTGRIYRRRGVEHQASAPGQPPASDSGALAGSGDVYMVADQLAARVNFASSYAMPLETGSRRQLTRDFSHGSLALAMELELGTEHIEPRPFARPSLAENVDGIRTVVAEQITAALK